MKFPVMAVCKKCRGHMTLKSEDGDSACWRAQGGRMWRYECEKCGREVVSPVAIPPHIDLPGLELPR